MCLCFREEADPCRLRPSLVESSLRIQDQAPRILLPLLFRLLETRDLSLRSCIGRVPATGRSILSNNIVDKTNLGGYADFGVTGQPLCRFLRSFLAGLRSLPFRFALCQFSFRDGEHSPERVAHAFGFRRTGNIRWWCWFHSLEPIIRRSCYTWALKFTIEGV